MAPQFLKNLHLCYSDTMQTNSTVLKSKHGDWLLKTAEDRLKNYLVPKLPKWLETYHLTYLTAVWSFLIILSFYFGASDHRYLFLVPIWVALQYLTDLLDGAVGRFRDTGLVRWGYYADHFLDFVFTVSIILGYGFLTGFNPWLFVLLAVASGSMVHTFLFVSAGNAFNISYLKIGPTEGRLLFIIAHLLLVGFGLPYLPRLLPWAAILGLVGLMLSSFFTQKQLWKIDMMEKGGKS